MQDAIEDFLREMIRDHWGMSMAQIENNTGMARKALKKTLSRMQSKSRLRVEGGRYYAAC